MNLRQFMRPTKLEPEFVIEYYPRTNLYFAKYGDQYLKEELGSGIITLTASHYERSLHLYLSTSCSSERQARRLIDLYKEQSFKEGVQIIKV